MATQTSTLIPLAFTIVIAYVLWKITTNLFLHPLAKIPGPRLAALSGWYECYFDVWQPAQLPFELKRLHAEYGPIIRPNPYNEVHISDPDFLDTIYALRGRNSPFTTGLLFDESVAGTEDFALHKLRRDALNPFFSQKAVLGMEELMTGKLDQVIQILESGTGKVVNLSDIFFAFSNDLVRSFCFGYDNALLEDLDEASRQRESLMRLLTGGKINHHFPFIPKVLGKLLGARGLPPALVDLLQFKAQTKKDIEAVFADRSNERKGRHSVFYELRDSPTLPPHEKSVERLQDEATLLVIAGTESTAKSLGYGAYYLLSNPGALARLRAELRAARLRTGTPQHHYLPLATLNKLPYLSAVIAETNRLTFGVTNRMLRYSPTDTITYTAASGPFAGTTYTLPPGTRMSCVTYCTHTDEALFPDPLAFKPERWLVNSAGGNAAEVEQEEAAVNRRKRAMMALGKGHRRCLGMHVAQAALALAFAALAPAWHLRLHPDTRYADVEFRHDYQIAQPRLDTKGIRVEVGGRRKDDDDDKVEEEAVVVG